jgi:fructokinase
LARSGVRRARRALVFGEALIDSFPDKRVVAGAPLNLATYLAARGWTVALISRLGRDADGRRIFDELTRRAVDTSLLEWDDALPTGEVTVELAGETHSFAIHEPAAWDAIRGPEHPPGADVLTFGTLAQRHARSRAALDRLLAGASGMLKVFDPNLRFPHVDREAVAGGLEAADVIKLNREEMGIVARLVGFQPTPRAYFEAATRLRWLCITDQSGAELHARTGGVWTAAAPPIEVVDTVGAGDAFAAGLIDGLCTNLPPQDVVDGGVAAAAEAVSVRGGLAPVKD